MSVHVLPWIQLAVGALGGASLRLKETDPKAVELEWLRRNLRLALSLGTRLYPVLLHLTGSSSATQLSAEPSVLAELGPLPSHSAQFLLTPAIDVFATFLTVSR